MLGVKSLFCENLTDIKSSLKFLDRELLIDPPPPRGNFEHYDFLAKPLVAHSLFGLSHRFQFTVYGVYDMYYKKFQN